VLPLLPVVLGSSAAAGQARTRPMFIALGFALSFAAAALLLAAIGVYGILSYAVSSRMRDIGVRLALGASARRVMGAVLREGLSLAGLGATIGLVASFAAARLAQRFLPDAAALDARLIGVVTIIMLAVAIAAALLPARRAGAVGPLEVLRHD